MFIISWTIDIRMNIQIWLLYRRYKSEWYNFWWATTQDIAACARKVWTLFGQACGQEESSQTTMMTTTTDKSCLHRLTTDILLWAKKRQPSSCMSFQKFPPELHPSPLPPAPHPTPSIFYPLPLLPHPFLPLPPLPPTQYHIVVKNFWSLWKYQVQLAYPSHRKQNAIYREFCASET